MYPSPHIRDALVFCLTEPTLAIGIPEVRALLEGRWPLQACVLAPPPPGRSSGTVQAAGRYSQREIEHHVQKAPLHL